LAIFIPEDKISEIKNTVDIVDIVSETVLLKKTGRNFVGLCPFHSEKTPSFTVSPEKQIFYCFGCGSGGNAFSFLMKQEGFSFPEAARRLAKRYGIDIPTTALTADQRRKIKQKESLFHLNAQALNFFRRALKDKVAGRRALSYLKQRGFSLETIDRFQLGYAPEGWDNLLKFLSSKQVSPALAETAGLVIARKGKSGFYDRFRDRIIFPIIDVDTKIVGFGGRVMDDSEPKYLNSPETPVYHKSRILFGLNNAREKCRTENTVFIVEGYLDLLALHQSGIENSVATLGTALTAEHIRLLTRYTRRMVLVYDSDEAGIRSAQRCIDTFWKEHVDFRREDVFREEKADTHILVLPDGDDPDSYLLKHGPEAFVAAAAEAPGIISFLIDRAIEKHGLSTEGKIRIVSDLQAPLAAINDSVARSLYIKQLSEQIDIDETVVLDKIRGAVSRKPRHISDRKYPSDAPSAISGSESLASSGQKLLSEAGSRIEQQIIAMMLQFPQILPEIEDRNVLEHFESNMLKSIGHVILRHKIKSPGQISELVNFFEEPDKRRLVAALGLSDESWDKKGCLKLIGQFVETIQRRHKSRLMDDKIRAAELNKDQQLLNRLLNEKQKLAMRSAKQKMALLNDK
jgi:DNA primase